MHMHILLEFIAYKNLWSPRKSKRKKPIIFFLLATACWWLISTSVEFEFIDKIVEKKFFIALLRTNFFFTFHLQYIYVLVISVRLFGALQIFVQCHNFLCLPKGKFSLNRRWNVKVLIRNSMSTENKNNYTKRYIDDLKPVLKVKVDLI